MTDPYITRREADEIIRNTEQSIHGRITRECKTLCGQIISYREEFKGDLGDLNDKYTVLLAESDRRYTGEIKLLRADFKEIKKILWFIIIMVLGMAGMLGYPIYTGGL